MDPLAFFAAHSGLRDLNPEGRRWQTGQCTSCNAQGEVTKLGKNAVCQHCVPLRQTYPNDKTKPMLMAGGSFGLITAERAIYWTYLGLDRLGSPEIEVRPANKQLRAILRQVILTPPEGDYLFIVFAPSNNARDFVLNRSRDTLQISNSPLEKLGPFPITSVNRRQVAALVEAQPDLKPTEWDALIKAQASLLNFDLDRASAQKARTLLDKHAGLLDDLPWLNSPEHIMLKQVAGSDPDV